MPPIADALGFPVLRESPHDLVVVKPAGMATELTRDPRGESLIARVRSAVPEGITPRLVHRLDRATRGVMIVTLSKEAAAFHSEQIRMGQWQKHYLARIPLPRKPEQLMGIHRAYIREQAERAELVRSGGRPSFLEVLAIDEAPDRPGEAHALIQLHTGRLHQIRVMLAGMGYPLIGDEFYGGDDGPFYLESTALTFTDFTTGHMVCAHKRKDPEREALGPGVIEALRNVTR